MGVKNQASSEYQRSFKSKYPCFTKTYEHNVDYRQQRRSTEHNHQSEPFLWDSDSSSNNSELSVCVEQKSSDRHVTVPRHIHKHEKYNKVYQDRLKQLTAQLENNLHVSRSSQTVHVDETPVVAQNGQVEPPAMVVPQQVEPPKQVLEDSPELFEESDNEGSDVRQVEQPTKHVEPARQHSRPRHPALKKPTPKPSKSSPSKHVPKPRPFSAPLGRPVKVSAQQMEEKRAPFVPYGFRDRETYTGTKKTYNIRASADIHPSALLALKRRKALIAKREDDLKSASMKEKKKRALFNDFNEKVKRETSHWATEYRSHFSGYDREIYERSLSARPASRHHDNSFLGATW